MGVSIFHQNITCLYQQYFGFLPQITKEGSCLLLHKNGINISIKKMPYLKHFLPSKKREESKRSYLQMFLHGDPAARNAQKRPNQYLDAKDFPKVRQIESNQIF